MMEPWIPAALIGLALLFLLLAVNHYLSREKRYYYQRLEQLTRKETEDKERESLNWKLILGFVGRIFLPRQITRRLTGELIKAGLPLKGEEFISAVLFLAIGQAAFFWFLTKDVGTALIFLALGLFLPKLFLNQARSKRLRQINDQIGDALLVMSNSLRAGFSFIQSMEMVAKEMSGPISEEFSRALREMQLGAPTEHALLSMSDRAGSDDLDMLVTAVLIQRQVGGNLAEVLDNISVTIRERIRIMGEIKTLTAQGKISGTIIGLLPFFLAMVLYLINRSYLLILIRDPLGLMLVIGGLVAQLIGMLLIRKIVALEY
ncbi:MAG TPA: secretion system protein [Clostridia bacterium]|nr:secretion system protein [Clostridia bacterium]